MITALMVGVSAAPQLKACTAVYHAPSRFMLKSYDWQDGEGDLYLNPRGVSRAAFPHESRSGGEGAPHAWQARYASLTFNQYGRGFPNGGVNELGLTVEVLWLNETRAPDPDKRPYLNELEWVQHMLDTQGSTAEVLQTASHIRVSPIHGQVHYMVCDARGACATLELLKGALVIHSADQLPHPVLTNHTYQEGLAYMRSRRSPVQPKERGSLARFMVAARAATHPAPQTLSAALDALKRVEIKGYTKWQIAYDLERRRALFRTSTRPAPRQVDLPLLIERAPNQARGCDATLTYALSRRDKGDIHQHFKPPQLKVERRKLKRRLTRLGLSGALAELLARHGARCRAPSPPSE